MFRGIGGGKVALLLFVVFFLYGCVRVWKRAIRLAIEMVTEGVVQSWFVVRARVTRLFSARFCPCAG